MKKKLSRKRKTAKVFTVAFFFLIIFGIAAGTYLVQKRVDLYTRSQTPFRPLAESGCPTTSTQNYSTLSVISDYPRPNFPPEQNPEINLALRGYEEANEKPELINVGGDTDPTMPPSLGTIFNRTPTIVKTYKVHKWDWTNNRRSPELESNWPVHLIGLATNPSEPLVGPRAGREIGDGNILMLIYATPTTATFVHGRGEHPQDGYFIHVDKFCVDPNLLSAYQSANASGRGSLPVIRTGQVFGYGNGSDVRIAIRDSGDWMDPRVRKDWWQGSDAVAGVLLPTRTPTTAVATPFVPSPTRTFYLPPTVIPTVPSVNQITAAPTQSIIYVLPSPTAIPTPTITLTPTPTKTLTQIIVENPVFNLMKTLSEKISLFLRVSLP